MGQTRAAQSSGSVAIVGMACRFPDASDVAAFWENLRTARTSFKDIPADRWDNALFFSEIARDTDKSYVRRGAFIDDVEQFAALHFGIAPRRVAVMDPQHRLLLEAVRVALQDAGLEKKSFDRSRMGTFIGISSSEYRVLLSTRTLAVQMAAGALGEVSPGSAAAIASSARNVEPISAFSIPGTLLNMAAANVAHLWNLGGPAYSIDAACASAMVSIYDAVMYLRAGVCDSALAGGVYLNLGPENLIGFARASAVSRSGECRPFDAASDGFLQGEGVGMLVLKRLEDAQKDGDRVWAVIRGVGINNDGSTSDGPMAPSLSGQADCLRQAYRDAGVSPSSVGLMECHGTATKVGDPVEVSALREVFSESAQKPEGKVYLGSVKANIGHTMSAAGVAGLMRATLALYHQTVPPQAGFSTPNPLLELEKTCFEVPREAVEWKSSPGRPRRAGISSFGFGGTNCHVVLEEAPPPHRKIAVQVAAQMAGSELVLIAADTRELLARHAREIAAALEKEPTLSFADVAFTLCATRKHDGLKLALVATSREELIASLKDAAERLGGSDPLPLKLSPSAFVTPTDAAAQAPKVAFLFPGQGAQRVGLLRWMYDRFETFRARLDALAKSLDGKLPQPLLSYLYPQSANGELKAAEERLQATEICQPVMAALGLALAQFLKELGIEPVACTGHSLGEFVAAGVGGILTPEEALRFAAERGRLMAALKLPDPGAMAAVRADPKKVEPFLKPGVGIANCNHPQQTVISGTTSAVEAAMAALQEAGIGSRRLRVSHAFHSELMAGVAKDIARLVESMPLRPSRTPVVSAITGEAYPDSEERLQTTRETFVRHATSRVDFVAALEKCAQLGADYLLEVGAGDTLSSFVRAGLPAERYRATSSLAAAEDDRGRELFRTLGMLSVLGQPIALEKLHPAGERQVVTLPAAPLTTERYWFTRTSGAVAVGIPQGAGIATLRTEANVSDDLVKLFREQTALLAQHAEIIARQTAALGGQPMPAMPAIAASPGVAHPVVESRPASPAPAATPKPAGSVNDVVMEAVAKVSAFPKGALKPTQSLVTDLGLDSLMLMELVSNVKAAFPAVGDIPQTLLNQKTTIADLVGFLEKNGAATATVIASPMPSAAAAVEPAQPQEAQRFRPVLVARERSSFAAEPMPENAWTLVTTDGGAVAEAVIARLAKSGRRVVAVRLGKTYQGATKDAQGVLRLDWPREAEKVDGLFAELAKQSARPCAVLHLADLDLSKPVGEILKAGASRWPNPVPFVQRLAASLFDGCEGQPLGFATATSLGGSFGLKGDAGALIWQVALTGFTKALSREWDAPVKTIDLDPALAAEIQAARLVEELSSADRDVEVGYPAGKRHVVALSEVPFDAAESLPFNEKSVVLVTGGASGLGARVALDLAQRTRCGLVIVDSRELLPGDETSKNLAALAKAGARAEYVRWDLRRDDLPAGLEKARGTLGPITAIIHCAGLIRDKRVSEKKLEDVKDVMDVKVAGLLNVLRATASDPLQLVLGFCSWAGRFGNAGQTDYSAANELTGRLLSSLPKVRPGVRGIAMLWPPWESSAMAKSIPAPLRERMRAEGIPFLKDKAGFTALRRQLSGREDGELLIGLGQPGERREVRAAMRLSVESHPFLTDHRIRGVPVVPMATALDLLASLAKDGAGQGGLELRELQLFSGIEVKGPVALMAQLQGKGNGPRQLELRAGGRVSYRAQAFEPQTAPVPLTVPAEAAKRGDQLPMTLEAFYRDVAFHGPRLQGIERVERVGARHIVGWVKTSKPAEWIAKPERAEWTVDPLVIDSSFQLVLYWLWANHHKAALPVGFKSFVQKAPFGTGLVKCTLVLGEVDGDSLVGSIQYEDAQGRLLAVMTDARAKVLDLGQKSSDVGKNGNGAVVRSGNGEAAATGGAVDERNWRIEKFPEVEALYERINSAAAMGLRNPYFNVNDGVARDTSVVNGREMIHYSGYNYLGLSGHPKVTAAAKAAVDRWGTSVSASRVASGEKPFHAELERAIADFLDCEASLVFSAGHATNEGMIGFMFADGDLIVHDSLAHNSIQLGAQLSPAKRRPFPHSDYKALDQLLTQLRPHYKKVLIAIEGVYSMDGDYPDLPRFIELRNKHKCLLLVDEAHSMGVMGKTGRGIGEHFGVNRRDVDIWMGTLSKAFGSCGGYVAGGQALIDYLKYSMPGFVFSAGITPANAAAAKAAVEEIVAHPELVTRLRERSKLFLTLAKERGIDTGMSEGSAVIPCIVGNSMMCLQLSQRLADRGINVQPIVYPGVEENAARLRFFLSSTHSEKQIRLTIDAIAEELAAIRAAAAQMAAAPAT